MSQATDWVGRSVLVTGCTGFLGSWVSRRLCQQGARVTGLSRQPAGKAAFPPGLQSGGAFDMVEGSLDEQPLLRKMIVHRRVDTIFHLAARSKRGAAVREPVPSFEANIEGTWHLLEAVRLAARPTRLVLASTDAVYGDQGPWPYSEDSPSHGTSPYATSKICAESLARCYHGDFGLAIAIARTANLYGGGDVSFERIVPGTVRAIMRGEAPLIRSDGRPEKEYLYVEDAVDAYLRLAAALDRPNVRGSTFNVSNGEPVSVSRLVDTILELMGPTDLKPRIMGPATDGLSRIHVSTSRAMDELGWSAGTSLHAGLRKTIAWYREYAHVTCGDLAK